MFNKSDLKERYFKKKILWVILYELRFGILNQLGQNIIVHLKFIQKIAKNIHFFDSNTYVHNQLQLVP